MSLIFAYSVLECQGAPLLPFISTIQPRLTTFQIGMNVLFPKTASKCPLRSSIRNLARVKVRYKKLAVSLSATTLLLSSARIQDPGCLELRVQSLGFAPPESGLRYCEKNPMIMRLIGVLLRAYCFCQTLYKLSKSKTCALTRVF